ncbi:MAG TPA: hydrogenase 4 subunit F, partial [Acetobacteraceae bacterium]|nr:hydrogenase 4 subunit F [Acetobacteraceae bacterium]
MTLDLFLLAGVVPFVPLAASALIAAAPERLPAAWVTIAASALAFVLACRLPGSPAHGDLFLVDPLAAHMTMLTAFVGATTAWFSRDYIAVELAAGRLDARRTKQYHALYLAFLGFMLMALLSNNLGVT